MSKPRQIRTYAYVNRPYAQVHTRLQEHAWELLKKATTSAATRADSLGARLRVGIGNFEVGVGIKTYVRSTHEEGRRWTFAGHTREARLGSRERFGALPLDVGGALR